MVIFLKGGRGLTGLLVCHAHLTNNFFRHCQDQKVGDQIDHRPGQLHCVQEVFAFPQLSNPSENQQKLQKSKNKIINRLLPENVKVEKI